MLIDIGCDTAIDLASVMSLQRNPKYDPEGHYIAVYGWIHLTNDIIDVRDPEKFENLWKKLVDTRSLEEVLDRPPATPRPSNYD